MSDVFYVKEGSTSPSIATTLLDPDDNPANVAGQLITFRMYGPDTITGAASFVTDGSDGQVYYDWADGDLATPGGYQAEWVTTNGDVTEIYPGAGFNFVEVVPAATTVISGLCTLVDVRRKLGRSLTDAEAVAAVALIEELSALLERRLHRIFEPRQFTETRRVEGRYGRLVPYKKPLISVDAVLLDGDDWGGTLADFGIEVFPYQSTVTITYTAGTVDIDAGVSGALANVVARTLQVAPTVASGAIQSYSVEGTSITYGDISGATAGSGNVGKFTVGDLKAFAALKIPVLAT